MLQVRNVQCRVLVDPWLVGYSKSTGCGDQWLRRRDGRLLARIGHVRNFLGPGGFLCY
jgi:hypothetical protein